MTVTCGIRRVGDGHVLFKRDQELLHAAKHLILQIGAPPADVHNRRRESVSEVVRHVLALIRGIGWRPGAQ